ncbi:MAG: ParA family protein [Spirochaetales bacterium]|nr:ParA family protein [Spirochaetales bacterium]
MATTLAIVNQKGGVGKTTTAVHLAAGLARSSLRTLLIDLDVQGNASSIFSEEARPELSAFEVFRNREAAADLSSPTRIPELFLLPAVLQLAEVETMLTGAVDGFFRLDEWLGRAGSDFAYVVIDCPPNLGVLPVNALVASDFLVMPLQASRFSLDGIKGMLSTCEIVNKRYNADLSVAGAVMTQFNPRTAIGQAMVEHIEALLPLYATRISRSVAVEEAVVMKQTIFEYQPGGKVAEEYQSLLAEIRDGIEKRPV